MLPGCQNYVRQEMTSLKLREKFFSFSGDDCTVRDMQVMMMMVMMIMMVMVMVMMIMMMMMVMMMQGRDWFKIEGSALSISSQRTMTDHK